MQGVAGRGEVASQSEVESQGEAVRASEAIMAFNGSMKWPAAALAALALLTASPKPAGAQATPSRVHVPSFAKLPDSAVLKFRADPNALLTTYASAGLPLATQVRSLALTDPTLVETLVTVAKSANDAQAAAIGAGLSEAARMLADIDPELAQRIETVVAQSGLAPLVTAFIAGYSAARTGSLGAGAVGGGESAGAGGPVGGVGASNGSNRGAGAESAWTGVSSAPSAFGPAASGGGFSSATSQSTSPSKSSI
jgi:hypothetical protein